MQHVEKTTERNTVEATSLTAVPSFLHVHLLCHFRRWPGSGDGARHLPVGPSVDWSLVPPFHMPQDLWARYSELPVMRPSECECVWGIDQSAVWLNCFFYPKKSASATLKQELPPVGEWLLEVVGSCKQVATLKTSLWLLWSQADFHGYPNFAWKMASYLQAPTN